VVRGPYFRFAQAWPTRTCASVNRWPKRSSARGEPDVAWRVTRRRPVSHALNNKRQRIRTLLPRRVDLLLRRRNVPRLRLLRAVELDQHAAQRRRDVEADDLVGADDEMTAAHGDGRGRFVDNAGLKGIGVVYFPDGDDDISRGLAWP
jgi:hypothetical protein